MPKSKDIFVAASFSSKVNYETGIVFPEYKGWLEKILTEIEGNGHKVYCALREDDYKINQRDPLEGYRWDKKYLRASDVVLALLDKKASEGVSTEAGMAIEAGKTLILGHDYQVPLGWFNQNAVADGDAHDLVLPFNFIEFNKLVEKA